MDEAEESFVDAVEVDNFDNIDEDFDNVDDGDILDKVDDDDNFDKVDDDNDPEEYADDDLRVPEGELVDIHDDERDTLEVQLYISENLSFLSSCSLTSSGPLYFLF